MTDKLENHIESFNSCISEDFRRAIEVMMEAMRDVGTSLSELSDVLRFCASNSRILRDDLSLKEESYDEQLF